MLGVVRGVGQGAWSRVQQVQHESGEQVHTACAWCMGQQVHRSSRVDIVKHNDKQQRVMFILAEKIQRERKITMEWALKIARYKLLNNGREPPTSKK